MSQPTGELSEQQIEEARHAFDLFDQDSNGAISGRELTEVLRALGQHPTADEVVALMDMADTDYDGAIDYTEFLALLKRRLNTTVALDDLCAAFDSLDEDGDGFVTAIELYAAMLEIGVRVTLAQAEAKLEEADLDGDGVLSCAEFIRAMSP